MIENVSNELRKYFEGKPVISSLLGLDMVLLYGYVALMIINSFFYLGGLISALLFYLFIISILLCLANKNFNVLMIGLGAVAVVNLIEFLVFLFKYESFSWSYLFAVIVYGFFAYSAYKKTLAK